MNAATPPEHFADGARRGDGRAPARVSVTVRTVRDTISGLVLDVSRSGARLFMDSASDCAGDVLLHWLGHDVRATVVWSRQYECAVQFARPLADDALAQISAALVPASESVLPPGQPGTTPDNGIGKPRGVASLAAMSMIRRPRA